MIAWFVRNSVAANCLMWLILTLGAYQLFNVIPLEVSPSSEMEQVIISVGQRGATPEDMEAGVTLLIEEAIADLPYVDELLSMSAEQLSVVTVRLVPGTDKQKALNEVKARVDALSNLPATIERPVIEVPVDTFEVLSIVIHGEIDEREMAAIARRFRNDIVRTPGVSKATLEGIRPYQISIRVSQDTLRDYGLTRADIAAAINGQALDLAAGQLRSANGDILLRSNSRAYDYEAYAQVVLRRFDDGSVLTLGDIAEVEDGFDDSNRMTRFNGERAAIVDVYRVGSESAIAVSDAVRGYLEAARQRYPETVKINLWDDDSRLVRERLSTLLNSGLQGALLVIIVLSLFLHPSVALWVVAGIPICFAGALALFPAMGITLNMISMFSFILVLGVVVDDAIVTGENIFTHRSRGRPGEQAAIEGTREVVVPVVFGVVTTMLAFVPMLMMDGPAAAHAKNIGAGVIAALLFSLVESKLILPAHLRRLRLQGRSRNPFLRGLERARQVTGAGLGRVLNNGYRPLLGVSLRHRYATVLSFVGLLVVTLSFVNYGWVRYTFLPIVESEKLHAELVFPAGTPLSTLQQATGRLEQAAFDMRRDYLQPDGVDSLIDNVIATTGGADEGNNSRGWVQLEIDQQLIAGSGLNASRLAQEWRRRVGPIEGVESLQYHATLSSQVKPLEVRLLGNDKAQMKAAVADIKQFLAGYQGVFDIQDTQQQGKPELTIALKPEAELLGLDLQSVTRQVRNAFFGVQAQRIQRGQDDVRVMVLAPLHERDNIADLEALRIVTPVGGETRFADIAELSWTQSTAAISRQNQRQSTLVSAQVSPEQVSLQLLTDEVDRYVASRLAQYHNLDYEMAGDSEVEQEANQVLGVGLLAVLATIFALLSVVFRSYAQPFIVMSVIPFALIGAIVGHVLTGRGLSMFSIFGMLALMGVVINDSLVLVDWINRRLREGKPLWDVVLAAGAARFRPILLTSLTTFLGLLPILFQDSPGAQFLIPMATSLGFGMLFATFITLLLVPCHYLILEDIKGLAAKLGFGRSASSGEELEAK